MPQLEGKSNGISFLVPIPNVFIPHFVVRIAEKTYKDTMNAALKASVEGPLSNVSKVGVDDPHGAVINTIVLLTKDFVVHWVMENKTTQKKKKQAKAQRNENLQDKDF